MDRRHISWSFGHELWFGAEGGKGLNGSLFQSWNLRMRLSNILAMAGRHSPIYLLLFFYHVAHLLPAVKTMYPTYFQQVKFCFLKKKNHFQCLLPLCSGLLSKTQLQDGRVTLTNMYQKM